MGWICRECGTENPFDCTRCRACDAKVKREFLLEEQFRAKRELRRYLTEVKRFAALPFRRLCRVNRALCLGMAALLLAWLCASVGTLAPFAPSLNRLNEVSQRAASAVSASEERLAALQARAETVTGGAAETVGRAQSSLNTIAPRLALLNGRASALRSRGTEIEGRLRRASSLSGPEDWWRVLVRTLRRYLAH